MDPDLVTEALEQAPFASGRSTNIPTTRAVVRFRAELCRFLQDLPGDATISDLRGVLDDE